MKSSLIVSSGERVVGRHELVAVDVAPRPGFINET